VSIESLSDSPDVVAVVLFGSTARRDEDAYSDKDVFVLCEDIGLLAVVDLKKNVIYPRIGQEEGVSCYTTSVVRRMADKGSLFLWHLKLEGKTVFSKNGILEEIYARLAPYARYAEDITSYHELLQDVRESLRHHAHISEFDLSLLFTIARNTCILLCHHAGTPKFGRSNAYLWASHLFGAEFPLPDSVYQQLCAWKLWYERGRVPPMRPSSDLDVPSVIEYLAQLIQFARSKCL
jgi:hypothetical protein